MAETRNDIAAQLAAGRSATDAAQARAAEPTASAWVSANAGTGKTHVLTNRVLRLLLAGTPPERILCLTYTKAAAAEMSERVFKRLAGWVTADDAALAREIEKLTLAKPATQELMRARDLFTVAIETPGGLKVQTIHAFAERLLQRFPLEAGIAPQFTVLDEETGAKLLRETIDAVLTEATRDAGTPLGVALGRVVTYAADDAFDDLLRDAIRHRAWIEAATRLDVGDSDTTVAGDDLFAGADRFYRRALGVGSGATLAGLDRSLAALLTDAELERIRDVLAAGSKSDKNLSESFAAARKVAGEARVDRLAEAFLTGDGDKRKRLVTKAVDAAHPDVAPLLARAQDRFVALTRERQGLLVVEATVALLQLASAVIQGYDEAKGRRAALDFDDLIRATGNLVASGESAQWVLFKLDGGLDHILVDEAQDTAPAQWGIIEPLVEEIFSGQGARSDIKRTVFAVGDEKQSIYGFQGAAPEQFAEMGRRFQDLTARAGESWSRIPLTLSFRTVAPILAAVDKVFADGPGAIGVTAGGDPIHHAANRLGHAGLVEIWRTEMPQETLPGEVFAPLADKPAISPVVVLAERIARTIGRWISTGERLASEDRPIRAGDVLVLVRRRRPFADAMVAALKQQGIPVAGADRIRLTEQLAVLDIVVLCDFLLLPEDDLALATVLKSPLVGLDDDDLTTLAAGRRGTLWRSLLAHGRESPRYAAAADTLKRWRARADIVPPFEFLVALLDRDGMRTRLLERLGPEAAEPLDELLGLALAYDESAAPSLQGFIGWLRSSEREIKRDMDHGRDEVRVMTVHGAKGLEAPIVFLPDTCSTASGGRPGGVLTLDDLERPAGLPPPMLWPVKGSKHIDWVKQAREAIRAREAAERNRLLYVAMTRPRDRLYVAGFEGVKGRSKGCWYDIICDALAGTAAAATDAEGKPVLRLAALQEVEPVRERATPADAVAAQRLPDWATRPAPRETGITIPLAPSRLAPLDTDDDGEPAEPKREARREPPVLPSSRGSDAQRFLRGTLTHALLEHLPGVDPAEWQAAAERFIAVRGRELRPSARRSIVVETLAVLCDPTFRPIFGPSSRAEVPVVADIAPPDGKGQTLRVAGQLDRLVQLDTHVLIVDYKTNRPPPNAVDAVAETYLLQLAAYRLAVAAVFKPLPVRAALLWTDGPRLMEVPAAMLDQAAARLFQLPRE